MPKFLTILSILAVSLYTAIMGYSLGIVAETDASVASSLLRNVTRSTTTVYAPATWKTWHDQDADESYDLMYPRDFEVTHADGLGANAVGIGTERVRISFPADSFLRPHTNFGEAYLTVSTATGTKAVMDCYANPDRNDGEPSLTAVTVRGNNSFHTAKVSDAAAGNRYDSRVYRMLRGSTCYEVDLTVHTGNIDNYPAGTVGEFDKERAFRILEKMLATMEFTSTP